MRGPAGRAPSLSTVTGRSIPIADRRPLLSLAGCHQQEDPDAGQGDASRAIEPVDKPVNGSVP